MLGCAKQSYVVVGVQGKSCEKTREYEKTSDIFHSAGNYNHRSFDEKEPHFSCSRFPLVRSPGFWPSRGCATGDRARRVRPRRKYFVCSVNRSTNARNIPLSRHRISAHEGV